MNAIKIIIGIILAIGVFSLFTACTTTRATGIDSLDESRLITAELRARAELARELRGDIESSIRDIEQSLSATGSSIVIVRQSIEDYRRLCQEVISRLQRIEAENKTTN